MLIVILLLSLIGCNQNNREVLIEDRVIPSSPVNVPPPLDVPDNPENIGLEIQEDQILLDLNTLSDNDRLNARYLIGCNYYNEGLTNLNDIEAGVNVGINSISTESRLERVAPIGVGGCTYRIDLDSFGLTRGEWQKIESSLLLDFVTESVRGQQIQFLTQSIKPYVFASDFFTTTTQADALTVRNNLYYNLVEQPLELADFFASIGVNVQQEFDDENVVVSGFSASQIALQKTRSVQALESDDGFVVTTYDSALSSQDSHFLNPFPLEAALAKGSKRSNKVFKFNAQEHIYTLPNGMMGFRLNGASGAAEVLAPNDVVINLNATAEGLDPTIFIGSCANCHSTLNPMLQFTDQLANHILNQGAFDAQEKELADVFFNQTAMEGRLRRVTSEYQDSLNKLGAAEPGDQDSLGKNIINPFRKEMDASQVAGYVMMPLGVFIQRLGGSNDSSQIFGNLLSGGTVSLGVLSANFDQLVEDLGAYKDVSL